MRKTFPPGSRALYVNDLRDELTAICKLFTVFITAFVFAEHAHAARPFVTDDARVVDPDHCQLETFYKEQRADSGREFWFLPACNQLGVEWTVGGNRIEGENNFIVQGKKLFKPLEPDGYGLALS